MMTTTTEPVARRRPQRGVALILVLWTFAAVATLAAEFARAMHDEAASTRNFKESTRARMVAIAGINEAILALEADRKQSSIAPDANVNPDEDDDPVRSLSRGDGQWVTASFQGSRYEVRTLDEAGKLSLNLIDAPLLLTIFGNLEIPQETASIISDSIVDWRDADDLHQPNGAESDYYEGLDRPYQAKNAAFDSVEELLLVRGVTHDIFYGHDGIPGLRDLFSVFNQTKTVNLKSVTPAVMQALGGLDAKSAGDFASARRTTGSDAAIEQLRAALTASGAGTRDTVPQQMTIEARVADATGQAVLAHIGAVVNLSSTGDGLKVYRWYDSIFDDSDHSISASAAAPAS